MPLQTSGRPPPRIGLDGYNLALEEGTGVATYARNLSYALTGLGAEVDAVYGRNIRPTGSALMREIAFFDPIASWRGGGAPGAVYRALGTLAPLTGAQLSLSGQVVIDEFRTRLPAFTRLWNIRNLFDLAHDHFSVWGRPLQVRLPQPPQVMHWTYPLPIEMVGAKNIYTLHDLVPLRLPHTTTDRKRRYLKLVRMIAQRADHIVTVSEASRADIIDILGLPETRVTNTYQAVDFQPSLLQASEAEVRAEVAGVLGLPYKGYFMFFGAIEPKKNVNRLLQSFLSLESKTPLLLVGKKAWKSERELKLLDLAEERPEGADRLTQDAAPRFAVRHGVAQASIAPDRRRVIQIDYVPLPLLVTLIRGAKAVVFPSVYEGFGLPVLEAMKLGTPVITSNTSSLPEVAGDAALVVDPYDPRAITAALRRMDTDPALRAELSARGLRQAERFSPAAYAARLTELYGGLGVAL